MIVLLNSKEYKAILDHINLNDGFVFDLHVIEKKTKRSIIIKDIKMRINIFNFIVDLLKNRRVQKQLFNNLFGLLDFTAKGISLPSISNHSFNKKGG